MSEFPAIASKIERLFAKASNTTNMHERDAFVAKAESLAAQYSITAAMLAAAAPAERSKPIQDEMSLPETYSQQFGTLANCLARAFDVDAIMFRKTTGQRGYGTIKFVGFPEDVEAVKMLFTHLAPIMLSEIRKPGSKSLKINLMLAFARRVEMRLIAERNDARKRYEEETGKGTALVLVDRKDQVKQEFRTIFPSISKIKSKVSYNSTGQRRGGELGSNVDLNTRQRLSS